MTESWAGPGNEATSTPNCSSTIAIAAQWQQAVESMFSLHTYSSEGFGLHGLYKSAVTLGYSL